MNISATYDVNLTAQKTKDVSNNSSEYFDISLREINRMVTSKRTSKTEPKFGSLREKMEWFAKNYA